MSRPLCGWSIVSKLRDKLQRSSDATAHRFLLIDGRIQEIPTNPKAFLKSGMLSTGAKLRMAGELFVPARKDLGQAAEDPATDETIDQFGTRRLGKAFADTMLDPMVKGVFGGESRQLSLAAAFPRMVDLEKDYGGLFKAMMKLARQKKEGRQEQDRRRPFGSFAFLHRRNGHFDRRRGRRTGRRPDGRDPDRRRCPDHQPDRGRLAGPIRLRVNTVPSTPWSKPHPPTRRPGIWDDLDAVFADHLAAIPFAPMAVIALGFKREAVTHDLHGFGMLVPSREKRDLLGVLWTSSIFGGRAPEGHVLLRCMAGGSGNPGFMDQTDEEMTAVVLSELRPLLGLKGAPEMVKVIRHDRAIAQYVPGHLARLKELDRTAGKYPGLYLTGSSYRGISVNACVKEAETVAENVWKGLAEGNGRVPTEALR